jgi:hypothetical protein
LEVLFGELWTGEHLQQAEFFRLARIEVGAEQIRLAGKLNELCLAARSER